MFSTHFRTKWGGATARGFQRERASKHAVNGLSKSAALEFARKGIVEA